MQHKNVNYNQVRSVLKQQFMLNKYETDPKKLEELKSAALRALTNYVMHISQRCGMILHVSPAL
jgi:hypothetical protein